MLRLAGVAFLATRRALVAASAFIALCPSLRAELLYFTEFEAPFTAGPNNWAGTDGWAMIPSSSSEVSGIDDNQLPGFWKMVEGQPVFCQDQSAFLGTTEPTAEFVIVYKTLNHDPVAEDTKTVILDTLIGIEDSTNGFYDSFWVSIFNMQNEFLGGLRFDVDFLVVRRHDGLVDHPIPGAGFFPGEHLLLCAEIDFQQNKWKVDMDGIPLFPWTPFSATGKEATLGAMSYDWQINGGGVSNHGNNWLLVADTIVWAIPPGEANFLIDEIDFGLGGEPQIEFTGEPGWTYQVEYTEDLAIWFATLPGSTISGIEKKTQVQFIDPSNRIGKNRWYRVVRSVTP